MNSGAPARLRRGLSRLGLPTQRAGAALNQPLLDERQVDDLWQWARCLPWPLLSFDHTSSHRLMGEALSAYRGRGLEFQENRPYLAGDEPRLINWRAYARSAQLHTKVFTEERRPQLIIVMDRRAGMRFGTRKQLKVTLAARIALCFLSQAANQGIAAGGYILDQQQRWFAPTVGHALHGGLQAGMIAPCPPLAAESAGGMLMQVMGELNQRLSAGCFVLLLSDCHDLDETAVPVLQQLVGGHTLRLMQILDPAELALPEAGDYLLGEGALSQVVHVRGADAARQRDYRRLVHQQQTHLRDNCASAGIRLISCLTDAELRSILEPGRE